jgi:hypothetical protein
MTRTSLTCSCKSLKNCRICALFVTYRLVSDSRGVEPIVADRKDDE